MSTTIIVGGQYGSEGKGKVVFNYAKQKESPFLVRCGGPNSGHSVDFNNKSIVLRQIPACPIHTNAKYLLSAGCVIDERILADELDLLHISKDRIIIDPRAVILEENDAAQERSSLVKIGSTLSGTGAALVKRMSRQGDVLLAGKSKILSERCTITCVAEVIHDVIARNGDVIIEGTQGFLLSLLHGPNYPYVTSRDTTASAFAMETGLSPKHIDEIIMVIRTYPIKVGGTSGDFSSKELTWGDIQVHSNAPKIEEEFTSVTKRLRRVAEFDIESVKRACRYNVPTALAVMGVDRLDYLNRGVKEYSRLSIEAKNFIKFIEDETNIPVKYIGTGFSSEDIIKII